MSQVEQLEKTNFLRLNICYESLEVQNHEEISLYDGYQFAPDLGMYSKYR